MSARPEPVPEADDQPAPKWQMAASGPGSEPDPAVPTDAVQPVATVAPGAPEAAPARRTWWAEFRPEPGEPRDLVLLVVALAIAGLIGGLVWSLLAPAERYEVVEDGVRGVEAESEALVGADLVFVAVIGVIGLIAAVVLWFRPRWRGPLTSVGLVVGLVACGLVAWQFGAILRPSPPPDELETVGQIVEGPLDLRAWIALLVPPVLALLVQVICAVLAPRDDLGHVRPRPASSSTGPQLGR